MEPLLRRGSSAVDKYKEFSALFAPYVKFGAGMPPGVFLNENPPERARRLSARQADALQFQKPWIQFSTPMGG